MKENKKPIYKSSFVNRLFKMTTNLLIEFKIGASHL